MEPTMPAVCDPEALFEDLDFLKETIRKACGDVPDKTLMKILG